MSNIPTFDTEEQYWSQNIVVAGIDEAGMGALAGPVVAGAVVFDCEKIQDTIHKIQDDGIALRDSKTLSAKRREGSAEWIQKNALAWAVGEASVDDIVELNIRGASHLAMRRAIEGLNLRLDLILIDGTPAQPHPLIPATNIIKGDQISCSIAAASILAKVHRDHIMTTLDATFPEYDFASHKGYGSKKHMDTMKEIGVTAHHRKTYAPVAALL